MIMNKKSILSLALSLILGSAAPAAFADATNDDDETSTFTFGYCGEPISANKPPQVGKRFCSAIAIDEQTATKYAGMRIVGVKIATGHACAKMPMTIFVSDNDQTFTFEQSAKMGSTPYQYETYTLDEPYDIVADKEIFVGFSAKGSNAYLGPIVFDKAPNNNPNTFLVAQQTDNGGWDWTSYASQYGANCIKVVIEGKGLPKNDASISLNDISFVTLGEEVKIPVTVTNTATTPLKTLLFNVAVADEEPVEVVAETNIPERDDKGVVTLKVPCSTTGLTVPVTVTLLEVNGVKIAQASTTVDHSSFICLSADEVFKRNVVMEEGTGTWCGWCPRGMVTIEKLLADYPDGSFIPIAVHKDDVMTVDSYSGLGFSSFPQCAINRDPANGSSVDYNTCKKILQNIFKNPAVVKVNLTATAENQTTKSFNFDAEVVFAGDASGLDYRLAFVITENNVGPYAQYNYFAGGSDEMDGWEKKSNPVVTTFNEVARDIFVCSGIPGSIPSTITAGEKYQYSYTGKSQYVKKSENCNFIALVINAKTGIIENAVSTKLKYADNTSIADITADQSELTVNGNILTWDGQGVAHVYSHDGRLVAEIYSGTEATLSTGLYIVSTSTGASKIAIK